jgi:hypothetical protein
LMHHVRLQILGGYGGDDKILWDKIKTK